MYKNKAFTIIELLVVILVLGIIIGIAIAMVKGMQQNGNLVKANKELETIQTAVESYRTFSPAHEYPPSTPTLQESYLINASPNVISSVLYDPFGATPTTEYNYLSSSNGEYYVVWTIGLTGQSQPTGISNSGDISY